MKRQIVYRASLGVLICVLSMAAPPARGGGECECDADLNNNGQIDPFDLLLARNCVLLQQPPPGGTLEDCDVNCDGDIDLADLGAVVCQANGGSPEVCCGSGACCIADGTACVRTTEETCEPPPPNGAGGNYLGDGTECSTTNAAIIPEPGGEIFVHIIGPPIDCNKPPGAPEAGCTGAPFFDAWVSDEDDQMCHNFGVEGSPPIPADFFAPGSEPFSGSVCLVGVPLGLEGFGDADTIIARDADPFDRCELPSVNEVTVGIEIVELSLKSVSPIDVMINGEPVGWDVFVDLSDVTPPAGSLTATKTHCNGGTYTSLLNVQPRFTFVRVGDPNDQQVLDTGLEGIDPVQLVQGEPAPWVSDVDAILGGTVDPCTDFHAGLEESEPSTDCDCIGTGQRDLCDIEDGNAEDCNENQVPDSCDIDSGFSLDDNGNGIPDECEPPTIVHGNGLPGETQPFTGYVDPRKNIAEFGDPGDPTPVGLTQATIRFSEPVFDCGGDPLIVANIELTETGGGDPPIVLAVTDVGDNTIVVDWDRPITLEQWTTIRVDNACDDTGLAIPDLGNLGPGVEETDRVDLAFLPADVDQNSNVTPFDLLAFRSQVNACTPNCGPETLPFLDIDRNETISPFDLLVFRQGINGNSPLPEGEDWDSLIMQNEQP